MVSTLQPDSIEKRSDDITKTRFVKLWIGQHGVSRKNEIKNVHINSKNHPAVCKRVVSNSPGLLDFVIGLVNSVLKLWDGQMNFFGKFLLQKNCNESCSLKTFFSWAYPC